MPRKLFDEMKRIEGENNGRIEYNPPEDKPVDSELVNRLVEHYINDILKEEKESRWSKLMRDGDSFHYEVRELESIIKNSGDKLTPQPLIDALTHMLRKEYDEEIGFRSPQYLTGVVQALYNLGYAQKPDERLLASQKSPSADFYDNNFIIDIRDWPDDVYSAGRFLKGTEGRPLIMTLYGDFHWCFAYARDCSLTLDGKTYSCGWNAVKCTFSLMPDTEIEKYWAAGPWRNNTLRKKDKDGEWETIIPRPEDLPFYMISN